MGQSPATRPSLLVRIRDARDHAAWSQFVEIYAPLIYGFGRTHGLQDADAADLTQDVLRAVAGAAGRLDYDPQRGSFRAWLYTVSRNKLANFLARNRRAALGTGDTGAQQSLEQQPASAEDSAEWDLEYGRRLLHWAAAEIHGDFQEATWQAFWQTAVAGKAVKEVAKSLGMSVGAVYIAKSRVLARLKERIESIRAE
jgi:RNA polymerase sigma-70 factor (ECF subfamily)